MAESFYSERYILVSRKLDSMIEMGKVDQNFADELLAQVRVFEERYPPNQALPPDASDITILVIAGEIFSAPTLNEALKKAREKGIEERPYFWEETLPSPSQDVDLSGSGMPSPLPNLPTLGDQPQQYQSGLAHG